MKNFICLILLFLNLVQLHIQTCAAQTINNFDDVGTPYDSIICTGALNPAYIVPGGPDDTGDFMRLATRTGTTGFPHVNGIAFNLSNPGTYKRVIAEFDFRFSGNGGDGMGFALLSTANYGFSGAVCAPHVPEEPGFVSSIGIGFDLYGNNGNPPDISNNSISIHFNQQVLHQFDASPLVLLSGIWIHAEIIINLNNTNSNLTLILTPKNGASTTIVNEFPLPNVFPYESRVYFGARNGDPSGTFTSDHDLDNVQVQFSDLPDESEIGQWSDTIAAEIVAIHMAMLPTGKVLYWQNGGEHTTILDQIRLFDPLSETITSAALPPYDIFCSGHSFLTDGRLFVAGGHDEANFLGVPDACIYNPFLDLWETVPPMNLGRWYPSTTMLSNGDILVLSGSYDSTSVPYIKPWVDTLPQIWQPKSNSWKNLSTADLLLPQGLHLYPRMFLTPDGRAFKAGMDKETWFLDPEGTGNWISAYPTVFGLRNYGSAVNYDKGKILILGGSIYPEDEFAIPTSSCEVINLLDSNPSWRSVGSMIYRRRHLNATILPDGTVLATCGTASPGFDGLTEPALTAELWNPDTESWLTMAAAKIGRSYHSAALLLPDARVLVGGGGRPSPAGFPNNTNFEIFSPPYLFKGPRPQISSVPNSLSYSDVFALLSPDANMITKANLIKLPSVTHAFDFDQRIVSMTIQAVTGDSLILLAPSNPNLCPPGYYMLFILDSLGIPSISKIISIDSSVTTGIIEPEILGQTNSLSIFPNPTQGNVTLLKPKNETKDMLIRIFSLNGQLIREVIFSNPDKLEMNNIGLTPGIYIITATGSRTYFTKLIVQP